jgi:hypothetical protein
MVEKMKKALSLTLALILVLSILASCSSESEAPRTFPNAYNSPPENDNGGTPTDDEDYTFGMNIEEFIEKLNQQIADGDYRFQSSPLNLRDFTIERSRFADNVNTTADMLQAYRTIYTESTGMRVPVQSGKSLLTIILEPETGEVLAVSSAIRVADGINATELQYEFFVAVDWHMILAVLGASRNTQQTGDIMMRAIENNGELKEGRYYYRVAGNQTHLFLTIHVPPRTQATLPTPAPSEPPVEPSPSPDDVDPTDPGDPYDTDPTPDTGGMDDILAEYDLLFLKNYSESINAQLFKQAPIRVSISELFTDNVWNSMDFSDIYSLFGWFAPMENDEGEVEYLLCETPFFYFLFYVENIFWETSNEVMIIRR